MSLIATVAVIGSITIFTLVLIIIFLNGKGGKIPKDRVKIVNFMRQYTEGNFAEGYQIRSFKNAERELIEFYPTDVNLNKNQQINSQKIVAQRKKIVELPKGSFSNNESQRWILPETLDDFPRGLKETYFGKMLMVIVANANLEIEESNLVKMNMEAQSEILKEVKGMKQVRNYIRTNESLTKDLLKRTGSEDRNRHANPFVSNKKPGSS